MSTSKKKPEPRKNRKRTGELGTAKRKLGSNLAKKVTPEEAKAVSKDLGEYTTLGVTEIRTGAYQRPYMPRWAKVIADTYDPALFEPLHVALRESDNQYYVVDGQHRLEAAKILNLKRVPVMLYIDTSEGNEAAQFVGLQERRTLLASQDRFHARIVAKDPTAIDIARIMAQHGFSVTRGRARSANQFAAVSALEDAYRTGTLGPVLWILREAWNGEVNSVSTVIVAGLTRLLRRYAEMHHGELATKMKSLSPTDVLLRSQIISKTLRVPGPTAVAQALLELYNHKRGVNRLPGSVV